MSKPALAVVAAPPPRPPAREHLARVIERLRANDAEGRQYGDTEHALDHLTLQDVMEEQRLVAAIAAAPAALVAAMLSTPGEVSAPDPVALQAELERVRARLTARRAAKAALAERRKANLDQRERIRAFALAEAIKAVVGPSTQVQNLLAARRADWLRFSTRQAAVEALVALGVLGEAALRLPDEPDLRLAHAFRDWVTRLETDADAALPAAET